jgi:thymidylate kinase
MHIAIEGIDGVGKTTIATILAEKLKFKLIEKPLHYLFDDDGTQTNYLRIRDQVNSSDNKKYTGWFYGLGNIYLYEKFQAQNMITDRHILSNYSWSGSYETDHIFHALIQTVGWPDYTFILHADEETLKKRIAKRDNEDADLMKVTKNDEVQQKMISLTTKYEMPHLIIDTSKRTPDDIIDIIIGKLQEVGLIG